MEALAIHAHHDPAVAQTRVVTFKFAHILKLAFGHHAQPMHTMCKEIGAVDTASYPTMVSHTEAVLQGKH